MQRRALGLALVGLLLCASVVGQDSRGARRAAMETITAADLKSHLTVLASDAMRGRVTPSKELDDAARYLAEQFAKAGASPAAPGGGFFQVKKTPVTTFNLAEGRLVLTLDDGEHALRAWIDADLAVRGAGSLALERAPVLVVSPADLEGDGSASLKDLGERVKGSVLLVPLETWTERRDPLEHFLARAEAAGAAGCLLVRRGWTPPPGLRHLRRARLEAQKARREASSPRPAAPGIAIEDAQLSASLWALATAGAESRPRSLAGASVTVRLESVKSDADVSNVVAMVAPAPGPMAEEALIFTAHYDHIGMTAPVDGDWIFNGADDDGSGTVALLELAQAFASLKPAPARKVLFCAFFGEERGGLGSKFYVENPAHPLGKTVCDVNIEMIGRSFEVGPKVVWVTGYDYSDLGAILAEGGTDAGVRIIPDPYPRQNFFLRSDNVAFVRHKVPGHSISAGSTHPDYHGVDDEVERIEFENLEAIVRAVVLGASRIADGSRTVRWTREIPRLR